MQAICFRTSQRRDIVSIHCFSLSLAIFIILSVLNLFRSAKGYCDWLWTLAGFPNFPEYFTCFAGRILICFPSNFVIRNSAKNMKTWRQAVKGDTLLNWNNCKLRQHVSLLSGFQTLSNPINVNALECYSDMCGWGVPNHQTSCISVKACLDLVWGNTIYNQSRFNWYIIFDLYTWEKQLRALTLICLIYGGWRHLRNSIFVCL